MLFVTCFFRFNKKTVLLKTVLLLFSAANLKHCRKKKKLKTCIFFRNRSRNRSLFPQSFPMSFVLNTFSRRGRAWPNLALLIWLICSSGFPAHLVSLLIWLPCSSGFSAHLAYRKVFFVYSKKKLRRPYFKNKSAKFADVLTKTKNQECQDTSQ